MWSKYSEYLGFRKAIMCIYHILYNTIGAAVAPQIKLITISMAKISIAGNKVWWKRHKDKQMSEGVSSSF